MVRAGQRWVGVMVAALAAGMPIASAGQQPAGNPLAQERARLKDVQEDIAERRERQKQLEAEANALVAEIDRATRSIIDIATAIQTREEKLNRLESQIAMLDAERQLQVRKLETRQAEASRLLAALQALSRRPPQLLLVRPGAAVDTARSARLLTTILPQLQAQTQELRKDIEAVVALRSKLDEERATYAAELAALRTDRSKLDDLLRERERKRDVLMAQADDEEAKARALASQASDIRDLVARLEAEDRRRARLARLPGPRPRPDFSAPAVAQAEPRPARPAVTAPPRTQTAALPPTVPLRTPGALPGALALPVRGEVTQQFGEDTGAGPSKGIIIRARADAQVVAPSAGRVMFSGPFRAYGQILIIAHGEDYHSLLAGMARIDARVGQMVQAGEPVGLMGPGGEGDGPTLYVELRRGANTVNPLPWLTAGTRRTQG